MRAIILCILLCACTTPQTMLESKKGQIVSCGGNVSSSLAGGAIGYHIQKGNDEDCVKVYEAQGFKVK